MAGYCRKWLAEKRILVCAGFNFVCYRKVDIFRYVEFNLYDHVRTEPCGIPDVTFI